MHMYVIFITQKLSAEESKRIEKKRYLRELMIHEINTIFID